MVRDHKYILELMDAFFLDSEVIRKFRLIDTNSISGWEIWLQIEFAHFLCGHSSNPQWFREESIEYDRRKEKLKLKLKPDFLIRKKGWANHSYMALEFKQDPKPVSCLKKMLVDLEKYKKIRGSNNYLRSIWTLGVFKAENIEDVKDKFNTILESHVDGFSFESLSIKKIGDTNYWHIML